MKEAIQDLVARTGENVTLRRATSSYSPSDLCFVASYVHGSGALPGQGRIGSLLPFRLDPTSGWDVSRANECKQSLHDLARGLARQTVGLETLAIHEGADLPEETILFKQEPALLTGQHTGSTIAEVVKNWEANWGARLQFPTFARWSVGEELKEQS